MSVASVLRVCLGQALCVLVCGVFGACALCAWRVCLACGVAVVCVCGGDDVSGVGDRNRW